MPRDCRRGKKKLDFQRESYFPRFKRDGSLSYADYVNALIDDALSETPEAAARLSAIQTSLQQAARPAVLDPGNSENPILSDRKAFESLLLALEERGVQHPERLTEFGLYARLDALSSKK
ncbi:hypothetical protein GGR92_005274 [Spirosoma lacussanchae]|uniref:hypothetical protein n=1 Tax=Spirosoma lacussanchae TaxID=1884249 RepID=UPI0011083D8C|nr:hypothetical protein [Spirosoma lacussanchae]